MAISNAQVDLVDAIFAGNLAVHSESFDLYVFDNNDPDTGGTDLTCRGQTVFCDGKGGITDVVPLDNTDCDTNGLVGTPGQGSCPA